VIIVEKEKQTFVYHPKEVLWDSVRTYGGMCDYISIDAKPFSEASSKLQILSMLL